MWKKKQKKKYSSIGLRVYVNIFYFTEIYYFHIMFYLQVAVTMGFWARYGLLLQSGL